MSSNLHWIYNVYPWNITLETEDIIKDRSFIDPTDCLSLKYALLAIGFKTGLGSSSLYPLFCRPIQILRPCITILVPAPLIALRSKLLRLWLKKRRSRHRSSWTTMSNSNATISLVENHQIEFVSL